MRDETMSKVKKELKRMIDEYPDDCSWDDVLFAIHMKKIMAPGYKSTQDSMILPPREIVDSWNKELGRRVKELENGKENGIPLEESIEQLRNRMMLKQKRMMLKQKRLLGFPKKSVKEAAAETAANLPDHADWSELAYRLAIRKKIEEALHEVRSGKECDHEEVFKELNE